MKDAVLAKLEELRPALAAHAGGVELVEINQGTVRLRFTGMCTGCPLRPLSQSTYAPGPPGAHTPLHVAVNVLPW